MGDDDPLHNNTHTKGFGTSVTENKTTVFSL